MHPKRQVFIIGYEPSATALGGIGRMLLAYQSNGLVYVGGVGTGLKDNPSPRSR